MPSLLPGLILALATAAAPAAETFEEAEALLDDLRAAEALTLLEGRLVEGDLEPGALARLWSLKGRALGLVGQGAKAQEAFAVALRIDPAWRLSPSERDPEISGPYHAALAALPPQSRALAVWLRLAEIEGGLELSYQLVADDLGLVSGAEIVSGGAAREVALTLEDAPKKVTLPADVGGAVSFRLLDAHGNTLREEELELSAGAPADPASSTPTRQPRWLALGGGSAMAAGALGVMAAGIGMAAVDDGQKAPDGTRDLLFGGVLVSTGLVVVGGALVATDFLLDPP